MKKKKHQYAGEIEEENTQIHTLQRKVAFKRRVVVMESNQTQQVRRVLDDNGWESFVLLYKRKKKKTMQLVVLHRTVHENGIAVGQPSSCCDQ